MISDLDVSRANIKAENEALQPQIKELKKQKETLDRYFQKESPIKDTKPEHTRKRTDK